MIGNGCYQSCLQTTLCYGLKENPLTDPKAVKEPLANVEGVWAGKHTDVFRSRSIDQLSPGEYCFSIILPQCTLDMQVEDTNVRNNWVACLSFAVDAAKREAGSGK